MTESLAAVLTALAVWLWPARRDAAARLAALDLAGPGPVALAKPPPTSADRETADRDRRALLLALPVGAACLLALGGVAGAVAGPVAAVTVWRLLRRREPPQERRRRERMAADLPFAVDLLAACLRAGRPVDGALDATAQAVGGPLGDHLAEVSGRLRLGAAPAAAWAVPSDVPAVAALGRHMVRSTGSGAPVTDALTRLADDVRRQARAASAAAARRVGVLAVAPLGLCFLPAFVLLGIVPAVAGLAGSVLAPGLP